jgi:ribosomal protein S18 acetylase RimI-like enzyme
VPEPGASPAYTLRPATGDDFPFLYDLHLAAMKDYVTRTWGWDDAVQREMFAASFQPANSQIITVNGLNVGVLAVKHRPDDWFLANIEIAPVAQGQGLGATIIRDLLAAAARDGLPARLQVLKVNPARRLYARLGFAITGETPTHYLMSATPRPPGREGG